MTVAALAILGPLAAALLILAVRRAAAGVALLGAAVEVPAAVATLVRLAPGTRLDHTVPGLPDLPLRLVLDPTAAVLATMVAVVDLLVLVYAVGYLRGDPAQARFFAEMSFFAAAMQTLVLAGDWVLFLAAWELIGLASYLLIGFWYARPGVGAAASRAFLTTRAADLGLYLGVFLLVARSGTTAIAGTLAVGRSTAVVAGLLLLVAAMGKSAQVPFQGWLQDAMVGPTPVSALLHSATLVAAGVILLVRVAPLFSGPVLLVVGVVGGLTILVTGTTALAQRDLKRLLASSTSSQVGFMVLAVGAGSPVAALAHLVIHAAIKSGLFLGAGVFQEARDGTAFSRLAGVGREHPRILTGFTVATLSLAGLVPLAGFWSKDAVIAAALTGATAPWLLSPLALVGTVLTGGYVGRALRLLWRGDGAGRTVAGIAWMGTGLTGLVLLAATLGAVVQPLGRLVGAPIPADTLAFALGLPAAVLGLAAGWLWEVENAFGRARGRVEAGFRLAGGFDGLVVRPVLALARSTDRLDRALHAGMLAAGRAGLGVARAARALDGRDEAAVVAVGRGSLALARGAARLDDRGIAALVAGLAGAVRDLGGQARRLQTGLISRELAFALAGIAVLVVVLLIRG